jgi:hypothetical protein
MFSSIVIRDTHGESVTYVNLCTAICAQATPSLSPSIRQPEVLGEPNLRMSAIECHPKSGSDGESVSFWLATSLR